MTILNAAWLKHIKENNVLELKSVLLFEGIDPAVTPEMIKEAFAANRSISHLVLGTQCIISDVDKFHQAGLLPNGIIFNLILNRTNSKVIEYILPKLVDTSITQITLDMLSPESLAAFFNFLDHDQFKQEITLIIRKFLAPTKNDLFHYLLKYHKKFKKIRQNNFHPSWDVENLLNKVNSAITEKHEEYASHPLAAAEEHRQLQHLQQEQQKLSKELEDLKKQEKELERQISDKLTTLSNRENDLTRTIKNLEDKEQNIEKQITDLMRQKQSIAEEKLSSAKEIEKIKNEKTSLNDASFKEKESLNGAITEARKRYSALTSQINAQQSEEQSKKYQPSQRGYYDSRSEQDHREYSSSFFKNNSHSNHTSHDRKARSQSRHKDSGHHHRQTRSPSPNSHHHSSATARSRSRDRARKFFEATSFEQITSKRIIKIGYKDDRSFSWREELDRSTSHPAGSAPRK